MNVGCFPVSCNSSYKGPEERLLLLCSWKSPKASETGLENLRKWVAGIKQALWAMKRNLGFILFVMGNHVRKIYLFVFEPPSICTGEETAVDNAL